MSDNIHFYEPARGHGLPHDPFNAIIAPRPIGWIASKSRSGILNLAPYSFFNGFNYHPPIIGFASVGDKDSVRNIQETREFVWNLATYELAGPMNQSCATVAPEVDEFKLSGLTPIPSRVVDVPRVKETPVAFECRLTQMLRLTGTNGRETGTTVVFGEVVGVQIDKRLLKDGVYQTAAANPILRAGGPANYFRISEDGKFLMYRPR